MKVKKERGQLREALDLLESHLGAGTRQYDSEDGTPASRVKNPTVTRLLRSVSKKVARSKEPEIVDIAAEERASEQVARLITHQAGARGNSRAKTQEGPKEGP